MCSRHVTLRCVSVQLDIFVHMKPILSVHVPTKLLIVVTTMQGRSYYYEPPFSCLLLPLCVCNDKLLRFSRSLLHCPVYADPLLFAYKLSERVFALTCDVMSAAVVS